MKSLHGIIGAMVTPMHSDGSINLDAIKPLVRHMLDGGVHGLFCLGTSGEFYALSDEEKVQVVRTVVQETAGAVPVFAGAGGISTSAVINTMSELDAMGIAGVSIVTPYYVSPSQEELFHHFSAIARAATLPVILYNIPMRTGLNLEIETVVRLSHVDGIVGIKDSKGSLEQIKGYIAQCRKGFCVLAGADSLIYDTLIAGGTGAIAATTNVLPALVASIYNHFVSGNLDAARLAQQKLLALRTAISMGTSPGALKAATNCIGVPVGPARLPVSPLHGADLARLKQVLAEEYGIQI